MRRPPSKTLSAWIAMDGGSTNTRVWLMCRQRVLARAAAVVGARDTARDGSPEKLRAAVRDLIRRVRARQPGVRPAWVAASGMITSPLGLAEVPHMPAPTGVENLARGALQASFPDLADLPFWLFPGVRCGDLGAGDVSKVDLMRGEETLCIGLIARRRAKPPFLVLNLGSHWKWIWVDEAGRIAQSRTSLTGELIHATQTATILASGLPEGKLRVWDADWGERGMLEARRSGLTRALFCVRLLETQGRTTPEQRLSFLLGTYVAVELDAVIRSRQFALTETVVLTGAGAVVAACQQALFRRGVRTQALEEAELETAFLAGLAALTRRAVG